MLRNSHSQCLKCLKDEKLVPVDATRNNANYPLCLDDFGNSCLDECDNFSCLDDKDDIIGSVDNDEHMCLTDDAQPMSVDKGVQPMGLVDGKPNRVNNVKPMKVEYLEPHGLK
ncbi:hypothetical protein E2C01_054403 [Portunus trituberculatus]|uniref:Uncharacterized protein n=1 Tax=Portunus trituberculatus TaxID=210409 RepID=A0A5B7GJB7_PORTR|nr:hypothetical protein [Portunus trituberculatus]